MQEIILDDFEKVKKIIDECDDSKNRGVYYRGEAEIYPFCLPKVFRYGSDFFTFIQEYNSNLSLYNEYLAIKNASKERYRFLSMLQHAEFAPPPVRHNKKYLGWT